MQRRLACQATIMATVKSMRVTMSSGGMVVHCRMKLILPAPSTWPTTLPGEDDLAILPARALHY